MYDGEDTTITPPATDAPEVEETVTDEPQVAEVAEEAADATETPAQA